MKAMFAVVGLGLAVTLVTLLSTESSAPRRDPFVTSCPKLASSSSEAATDLLTPLPDEALGLTAVLERLHATSVQAFESVPPPYFGDSRMPTTSLLDELNPPKHIPLLATNQTAPDLGPDEDESASTPQSKPNEVWLWMQLMYGVTDRGFVYRTVDLRPDTVSRSLQSFRPRTPQSDWRAVADSKLSNEERKAANQMVVGFPIPSVIKSSPRNIWGEWEYRLELASSTPATSDDRIWRVRQMQLVSLLKNDPPVVYEGQHFPAMNADERKRIPSRQPNEIELASLEALKEGKDHVLAWNESEERLQMLGAIRAKDTCLKCHQVKQGDLLGAFSYWIDDERKTPPQAAASQDEAF